jgi:hypothetical protein
LSTIEYSVLDLVLELCCSVWNLCLICFVFPLFPCRAVAGVSSGLPILFSCFGSLSHASTVVVSRVYSLATSVLHGSTAPCWVSSSDLLVGFHFLGLSFSICRSQRLRARSAFLLIILLILGLSLFDLLWSVHCSAVAVSSFLLALVAHRSSVQTCVKLSVRSHLVQGVSQSPFPLSAGVGIQRFSCSVGLVR